MSIYIKSYFIGDVEYVDFEDFTKISPYLKIVSKSISGTINKYNLQQFCIHARLDAKTKQWIKSNKYSKKTDRNFITKDYIASLEYVRSIKYDKDYDRYEIKFITDERLKEKNIVISNYYKPIIQQKIVKQEIIEQPIVKQRLNIEDYPIIELDEDESFSTIFNTDIHIECRGKREFDEFLINAKDIGKFLEMPKFDENVLRNDRDNIQYEENEDYKILHSISPPLGGELKNNPLNIIFRKYT